MTPKDIQAAIERARVTAAVNREAQALAEASKAREEAEANRKALVDRADRFLQDYLEKIVTRELTAGKPLVLILEADESEKPFVKVLWDKLIEAGFNAVIEPIPVVSGKMGYGLGDDTEYVLRVYLELDPLPTAN